MATGINKTRKIMMNRAPGFFQKYLPVLPGACLQPTLKRSSLNAEDVV
jgi:hypothetical protein